MLGTLVKMQAYKHAPRATFAALHPKKSAQVAHLKYDLRHSAAPRLTAVGAALIAMPLGFMLGKVLTGRKNGNGNPNTGGTAYDGMNAQTGSYAREGASPLDPSIH